MRPGAFRRVASTVSSIPRLPEVNDRAAYLPSIKAPSGAASDACPASVPAAAACRSGPNAPGVTIQISHEMVKQHDDLFTAPDLIPEEIGCGFDGCAMTGGSVAQVDARIAQRRIDQLRASGLVQRGSKQVARISDCSPRRSTVQTDGPHPGGAFWYLDSRSPDDRSLQAAPSFHSSVSTYHTLVAGLRLISVAIPSLPSRDLTGIELVWRNCCSSRIVFDTSALYSAADSPVVVSMRRGRRLQRSRRQADSRLPGEVAS